MLYMYMYMYMCMYMYMYPGERLKVKGQLTTRISL